MTATNVRRKAPVSSDGIPAHPVRFRHLIFVQLAVLLGFIGAGVAVTWPHATYLDGKLPYTRDAGSYVWGFWWVARSVLHLHDPWVTNYIAAPTGAQLGLHALMPLVGVVMLPVTVLFGPSASFNLLSIVMPGLLGYAMYRVARLWLPSQAGPVAAGAFYGLSGDLCYQAWVHINLVAGALFLPIALEAAIRLQRKCHPRQAVVLGLVLGASVLVDQESTILTMILTALALLPWLWSALAGTQAAGQVRRLGTPWDTLLLLGLAGAVALVVAIPQLIAVIHAAKSLPSITLNARGFLKGIRLPDMFLPSPRVTSFGLNVPHSQSFATFGGVALLLALLGFVLARRQRSARLLALLFVGAAALSLGSSINLPSGTYTPLALPAYGVKLSLVLPYTWFALLPGLSGFREPSRISALGLVPLALLAGYAVNWIRYHVRVLLVAVLALGILELGMGPPVGSKTMPTSMPALDRPIAADHSSSVVVDIPFGLRGGLGIIGKAFAPQAQVLATADGHPLADALLSRVLHSTAHPIEAEPFYHDMIRVQKGHYRFTQAELLRATRNAIHLHIGWVLLWVDSNHLRNFLVSTGFSYDYRADGVSVWRPRSH